jgi:undecaprenyl-diphosphatase
VHTSRPPSRGLGLRIIAAARHARRHRAWSPALAGLLVLGALGAFAYLAGDVIAGDRITLIDHQWARWLHAHATPALTRAMLALSAAHELWAIGIYTAMLAACLLRRRQRDWLLCLLFAVPGGIAINTLIKHLVARPRPSFDDPIVTLATFSFPSGHVSASTLLYGFLAAWLVQGTHQLARQLAIVVPALLMVALIAASRMYLGAHFLSDVLAAFFEGIAWLGICLLGRCALRRGAGARPGSAG